MALRAAPQRVRESKGRVVGKLARGRDSAFERFPLLFTMLTTFGVVVTLYGFERLIDRIEWLNQNAYVLLATGIITLIITGALYKKL